MQVVATREGFYGSRVRKAGDHFDLTDKAHLSNRWMAAKGTDKYETFMSNFRGGKKPQRDKITGERLEAGGMAEQLAVALDENRKMANELRELRADLEALRARTGDKPVESPTPAETPEDQVNETSKPVRRRRKQVD